MSEHRIQAAFFDALARWGGHAILAFAVPNDGQRSPATAAWLKRQGLRAGTADVVAVWSGGGCFLEFKTDKGRQNANQRDFQAAAEAVGWPYRVVRSWEAAWWALDELGAPLAWRLNGTRMVKAGDAKHG